MKKLTKNAYNYFTDGINLIKELFFYKGGALDEKDDRDWVGSEVEPIDPPKAIRSRKPILFQIYSLSQFFTKHCSAYSGAIAACLMVTTELKDHSLTIEGKDVWDLQIKQGTAREEVGDYVRSSPKAICNFGVKTCDGSITFKPFGYARIKKEAGEFKVRIDNGQPIMTGADLLSPMASLISWIYRRTKEGRGHAFCVYDYDDEKRVFYCINSWGRWGFKKSGTFFVRYEDIDCLYTPFIFLKTEKFYSKNN